MKSIVAFLACLAAFRAPAQKIRFTDTTNRWSFAVSNYSEALNKYQYSTGISRWGRDSVYKGTTYRTSLPLLIREDTATNRLFFRFATSSLGLTGADTLEQLYFDYDLRPGDSFQFQYADVRVTAKVAAFDSVLLGAAYYHRWNMHVDQIRAGNQHSTYNYEFIEGIGCLEGFIRPVLFSVFNPNGQRLYCFENQGAHPAIQPALAFYLFGTGDQQAPKTDSFNNSTSCALTLSVDANVPLAFNATVRIVPNPGGPSLCLLPPSGFQNGDLRVCNGTGQVVGAWLLNNSNPYPLGRTLQLPGTYFFVLEEARTHRRYHGRFVFE